MKSNKYQEHLLYQLECTFLKKQVSLFFSYFFWRKFRGSILTEIQWIFTESQRLSLIQVKSGTCFERYQKQAESNLPQRAQLFLARTENELKKAEFYHENEYRVAVLYWGSCDVKPRRAPQVFVLDFRALNPRIRIRFNIRTDLLYLCFVSTTFCCRFVDEFVMLWRPATFSKLFSAPTFLISATVGKSIRQTL